jgi:hypothetical protein
MQYEHKELDNRVRPWWTTSLVPSLKWVGLFINSTKELAKYISIPHFGVKLQNICLDQKTNTTTTFVASFYLKMTVSMPRSESDTFRPKRHPCLDFHATAPTINDWIVLNYVPILKNRA